jgi:hypothetical protein
MATTTNYGWTTPDDTALVKDGAAAIRTLGSSIDTTTKNLNPETTLGDIAYRSSTANVKTRLALGTANQQLRVNAGATAPEWFTPAAAGSDYKLIQTTTFSAVASISLNNVFTSTYENYEIYINSFPTSTADTTTFRLRASGTDATTNYECGRLGFNGSVVFSTLNPTGTDDWYIGYDGSATNSCAKMTIFRPQLAEPTKFYSTGVTGAMPFQSTGGTNSNSTSYDGFTLAIITGTFTGNVSVYGLAK